MTELWQKLFNRVKLAGQTTPEVFGFEIIGYFKEGIHYPEEMERCDGPITYEKINQELLSPVNFGFDSAQSIKVVGRVDNRYALWVRDERGTVFLANKIIVEAFGFKPDNFRWIR